jgi:Kef-type K+ transport system membrane component KefB
LGFWPISSVSRSSPAYLIAGFFIGPFGIGWVKSQESIGIISELGLIFMPFMIGLEIDLRKIMRAGRKSRSALRNDAGAGSRVRLMLPAQK